MPVVVVSAQDPAAGGNTGSACLHIALVNNMPDSALEETESQFFQLLDTASESILVRLSLVSLPNVPRTSVARTRIGGQYFGIDELWNGRFDAVIVTGCEPRSPDLRQEPYWPDLANVLDWAKENTVSTVLSCLAAHAGVLHTDGIERHPLADKLVGVFEFRKVNDHALTAHTGNRWRFPHSRWNDLRADDLRSCGYMVLTQSEDAGVDVFVKKKQNSLFAHFQGHPEYGALTLLKEYRRDTKRFLKGITETHPSIPCGCFDAAATGLLDAFRRKALVDRSESLMAEFPETDVANALNNTWQSSATRVYRNWLRYVVSRKDDGAVSFAVSPARPALLQSVAESPSSES